MRPSGEIKRELEDIIGSADVLEPSKKSNNRIHATDHERLTILHLDVGQGACTLLIYTYPEIGHWVAVIDGGHGNPGRGQLLRYLKAYNGLHKDRIEHIDAFILTHYDDDHADGLANYMLYHHDNFLKVQKIYAPYKKAGHTLTSRDVPVQFPPRMLFDDPRCRLKITCYANPGAVDENAKSLALLIQFGSFRYYTAGDLPAERGEDTRAQTLKHRVDAINCSHHGSAHSTSDNLLNIFQPTLAFVSTGRNSYGHPNSETIARLKKTERRRIYLTGCQYNRKHINAEYHQYERSNLIRSSDAAVLACRTATNEDNVKEFIAAVSDSLSYLREEGDEKFDDLGKSAKQLLQNFLDEKVKGIGGEWMSKAAAVRDAVDKLATERMETGADKDVIGFVAGGPEAMGVIALRLLCEADEIVAEVGFSGRTDSWQWRHRYRKPRDDVNAQLEPVDVDKTTDDEAETIAGAVKQGRKQPLSPNTFRNWAETRRLERSAFSRSNRTPRQPTINVAYKCRLCKQKDDARMVLILCELCQTRGVVVAYHEACYRALLTGEKGDDPHGLRERIGGLLEQREIETTPVVIPEEFEGCYRCGVFRPGGSDLVLPRGAKSDLETAQGLIQERRKAVANELLGVGHRTFGHYYYEDMAESPLTRKLATNSGVARFDDDTSTWSWESEW